MIRSIKITNFKSIIDSTATLPEYGAVVGVNAAGKSNLITAIELTKSLIRGVEFEHLINRYGSVAEELFNQRENRANEQFAFEFELVADNNLSYRFALCISIRRRSNSLSTLAVYSENLEKYTDEKMELVYRRDKDGVVTTREGTLPESINVGDDKLFISFFDTPDTENVKKIFSQTQLLASDVGRLRTPSLVMQGSEFNRTDKISTLVGKIMKDKSLYDQFSKIIKNLIPSIADFREIKIEGPKVKNSEFFLLMQENNLQRELSTRALSEGDLRTLAIVAMALEMPEKSTFIIEEIENGMHPARAKKLIEHLDAFSKIKNIQILFTTHSPLIIDQLRPDNVLFVTKNGHGTRFVLLSESEEVTQIKNLLKSGASLSDYLAAKLVKYQ